MDSGGDCTIWYVGDYLEEGAKHYSSRSGAFRIGDCAQDNSAAAGQD